MCDPHTRKPRGFGFITYDSVSAVDRACVHKFHDLQGALHARGALSSPLRPYHNDAVLPFLVV